MRCLRGLGSRGGSVVLLGDVLRGARPRAAGSDAVAQREARAANAAAKNCSERIFQSTSTLAPNRVPIDASFQVASNDVCGRGMSLHRLAQRRGGIIYRHSTWGDLRRTFKHTDTVVGRHEKYGEKTTAASRRTADSGRAAPRRCSWDCSDKAARARLAPRLAASRASVATKATLRGLHTSAARHSVV